MKRLLALLLSILTLFSLCACDGGKKDTNSKPSEHSVDVAYFASLGKIPELEYALGTFSLSFFSILFGLTVTVSTLLLIASSTFPVAS